MFSWAHGMVVGGKRSSESFEILCLWYERNQICISSQTFCGFVRRSLFSKDLVCFSRRSEKTTALSFLAKKIIPAVDACTPDTMILSLGWDFLIVLRWSGSIRDVLCQLATNNDLKLYYENKKEIKYICQVLPYKECKIKTEIITIWAGGLPQCAPLGVSAFGAVLARNRRSIILLPQSTAAR